MISKNLYSVLFVHCTHSDHRDIQDSHESPGLSYDASYKLWQKLHQKDNPGEVSLNKICMETCIPIKSGINPVLKSKDNFWLGNGADLGCTIQAFDGQGTTPNGSIGATYTSKSKQSAAWK